MFYQQLIALCEREGVKPTPLVKSLGFSAGNIKRWENGATVNSDILLAISKHFKVSIDYLLTGEESQSKALNDDEQGLLKNYKKLSAEDKKEVSTKVEELANGTTTEKAKILEHVKSIDLREREMLMLFRNLSEHEQERLIGRAELLVEQSKLEENIG